MKKKWILLCLAAATLSASLVNAEVAVLLMGNVRKAEGVNTTVTGATKAIIKDRGEQTTVTADAIAFDPTGNLLLCSGASVVTAGDRTIKGNDLRIELAGGRASVFIVNPKGTLSLGESRGFDSWKPDSDLPQFAEQLPDVDLNLKSKSPRKASPQTKGPRD